MGPQCLCYPELLWKMLLAKVHGENTVQESRNSRTALLAGATGLVGGHLLDLLLEESTHDHVISLVRRPTGRSHGKLDERQIDFNRLEEVELSPIHDVFCCLGTTIRKAGSQAAFRKVDHDYVVALAHLGRAAGAERFLLVSAIGASPRSSVFYSRVKGEAEEAVATLGYDALHIFQPSMLLGQRQEFRLGERLGIGFARLVDPLMAVASPLAKYRGIQAQTVAAGMVTAARAEAQGLYVYKHDDIVRLAVGNESVR